MEHKPVAGLLIASAFAAGVGGNELLEFQPQELQQLFEQESRTQIVIGRTDHGPEQQPRAVQTLRSVQTLVTTPAANRLVIFDGLQENSTFSDNKAMPVTYTAWIR